VATPRSPSRAWPEARTSVPMCRWDECHAVGDTSSCSSTLVEYSNLVTRLIQCDSHFNRVKGQVGPSRTPRSGCLWSSLHTQSEQRGDLEIMLGGRIERSKTMLSSTQRWISTSSSAAHPCLRVVWIVKSGVLRAGCSLPMSTYPLSAGRPVESMGIALREVMFEH